MDDLQPSTISMMTENTTAHSWIVVHVILAAGTVNYVITPAYVDPSNSSSLLTNTGLTYHTATYLGTFSIYPAFALTKYEPIRAFCFNIVDQWGDRTYFKVGCFDYVSETRTISPKSRTSFILYSIVNAISLSTLNTTHLVLAWSQIDELSAVNSTMSYYRIIDIQSNTTYDVTPLVNCEGGQQSYNGPVLIPNKDAGYVAAFMHAHGGISNGLAVNGSTIASGMFFESAKVVSPLISPYSNFHLCWNVLLRAN